MAEVRVKINRRLHPLNEIWPQRNRARGRCAAESPFRAPKDVSAAPPCISGCPAAGDRRGGAYALAHRHTGTPARPRPHPRALLPGLGAYVCNIETLGGCQYGPRYRLPAMPFAALGLAGFGHLRSARWRMRSAVLALCTAVFCATVNVLGAMYGAMYCELRRYAIAHYVDAVRHDVFRSFPLTLWLVGPLGLWMVWATALASDRRHELKA